MVIALVLGMMLFSVENSKFIKMVDINLEKGYNWEYVGKNNVKSEDLALPIITEDGSKLYYFYLGEHDGTK